MRRWHVRYIKSFARVVDDGPADVRLYANDKNGPARADISTKLPAAEQMDISSICDSCLSQ